MDNQRTYQNWFIVSVLFFLVAFAITLMMYKIPTIMTQIMDLLSVSASTAAWFMSVFTFTGIFFAVPAGVLIKKFGPKKVVLWASLIAGIASVIGGFAPVVGGACVPLLIITRGIEGLSFVSIIAALPVMISLCVVPQRTGTATGIFMLGGMLGAMGGGVITPTVFQAAGFQGLWFGYGAFIIVAVLIFAIAVKMPVLPAPPAGEIAEQRETFKEKYGVFFKRNTLFYFLGFALFQILLLSVLAYAPTALQQRGMSPTMSGFVSTLPQLIAIVSSIAFGAIADALHRAKPLYIIGILAMAVCAPLALITDVPLLWVVLVIMGLLAMGVPTIAIAAYPDVLGDPSKLTVGMGIIMLVQCLGQFLGSLVPSMLLGPDLSNWTITAIVLFVMGLVATLSIIATKFK